MAARNSKAGPAVGPLARPRQPPIVKHHARDQWAARYGKELDALWKAWPDAVPVAMPACYDGGDEARYHPETHAVLIRCDRAIVTVLDTIGADAYPEVRNAIEQQLDVELPTQEDSR